LRDYYTHLKLSGLQLERLLNSSQVEWSATCGRGHPREVLTRSVATHIWALVLEGSSRQQQLKLKKKAH
jgi:hypothetical protein